MHVAGHRGAAVFHRARDGDDAQNPLRPVLAGVGDDASSVASNISSLSGGGGSRASRDSHNPLKKALTAVTAFGKKHPR